MKMKILISLTYFVLLAVVGLDTHITDINECHRTPEVCSQICVNTNGSYHCKCNEQFYETSLDSATCKRRDNETAWLLLIDKYYVLNHSIDSQKFSVIRQDRLNLVVFDYDFVDDKLYFSDVIAKRIYQSDNDVRISDFSVDWIGRKLYWLDEQSQNLEVSELNGTNRKTILTGIKDPVALALHPGIGYVFFTSLQSFIGKIGMDGSNMTQILTWKYNMSRPNAITIDYLAGRLYWADAHFGHIAFSDYEGHHRHTVISGEKVAHILALSIFDDYVFWSDAYLKAIMRANKLNGSDIMTLRHSTHQMYDLSVYHKLRQLQYNNPCGENNGGCSHLCLIAPREDRKVSFDSVPEDQLTTYKCACPNPFYLLSDGRTCDRPCSQVEFKCKSNGICFSIHWKCDGEVDCLDRSDEDPEMCGKQSCNPETEFSCQNGRCISNELRCDHNNDCTDGSDEENCEGFQCPNGTFQCASGHCIESKLRCNGVRHCKDWSDETNCPPYFTDTSKLPIRSTNKVIPDAPYEITTLAPAICPCQNDGKCIRNSATLTCECGPNFSGQFCDVIVSKSYLLPIILILAVLLAFVGIWLFYIRGKTFGTSRAILSNNIIPMENLMPTVSQQPGLTLDFTNPICETVNTSSILNQ